MNKPITYTFDLAVELQEGIALLISTPVGSMPLCRDFGVDMTFLDHPTELAKSLFTAEAAEKIAAFFDGYRIELVSWEEGPGGIAPKVVITHD
jgi:hypothetical protein